MKYITVNLLGADAPRAGGLAIPAGIDIDPILIGIVLGGLVVSFGFPNLITWGVDKFLNEPADAVIAEQKQKLSEFKVGSERLVERQKELDALETDYRSLQGLIGPGGTWAGVMEELRAITPTDLWLTSMTTDGSRLDLTGQALDYKAVAYFYTNFQSSRNFAGPVLGNISEQAGGDGGRPVVTFTMRASIVARGMVEE